MKKTLITVVIAAITFCSGLLIGHRSTDKDDSITFIWNDDEESIPMDNTPILLEFGSKNSDTIYIGPLEQNSAEY